MCEATKRNTQLHRPGHVGIYLIAIALGCMALASCKSGSDNSSSPGNSKPAPVTYSLNYTAGPHGSITGDPSQTVQQGKDGTAVTAVATSGYHFVSWSDASTANPRTDANVMANISVSASFAINQYPLTTVTSGNGSGTFACKLGGTSTSCAGPFNHGTVVTVTAIANANASFTGFSGACSGTGTCNITMDAAKSVTASFALTTYTLTYTAGPHGSINGTSPQTVNAGDTGSSVTAMADAGYAFDQWSDASTANPRMDTNVGADVNVTAAFVLDLAAPVNVSASAGDQQVSISWDPVPNAAGYNLCYAEEPINDFDNCATFMGGTLVMNASSPRSITALANGTQYYFRIVASLNGESGPPSAQVSATPTAPPPFMPVGGLNDTGIDWCADDTAIHDAAGMATDKASSCATLVATHPGQDGMLGRDATARQDAIDGTHTLGKIGAGEAGFDFTKVCNSGEVAGEAGCPANPNLGSGANNWGCTRDNVTGLIWEVKTDDGGLRDKDNLYFWFNSNGASNGGGDGSNGAANGNNTCIGSDCDTQNYVAAVNAATLCGANDWRLPDVKESQSIIHYGHAGASLPTDSNFFPNAVGASFWTSAPNDNANAWEANFNGGSFSAQNKGIAYHARVVRAGPAHVVGTTSCAATAAENMAITPTTPTANFTDNNDGTVTDVTTGLMWKRCSQGQTWEAGTQSCGGTASYFQWGAALQQATAANNTMFAGHSDWRLPNIKELTSIVERSCFGPAINANVFPDTVTLGYWSSSPNSNGISWSVHFQTGATTTAANTTSLYVRLVRTVP